MKALRLLAMILLCWGAAAAGDDPMAGTYGNTVVITNAKGEVSKFRFAPDQTFTYESARGDRRTGTWVLKDGLLCVTTHHRPEDPTPEKESCSEFKGEHQAGDTWQQTNPRGDSVTVTIVAGT